MASCVSIEMRLPFSYVVACLPLLLKHFWLLSKILCLLKFWKFSFPVFRSKLTKSNHQKCFIRPATILKKRLWHRCFPVNFAKFSRTHPLRNTSGRLLLTLFIFSFVQSSLVLFLTFLRILVVNDLLLNFFT